MGNSLNGEADEAKAICADFIKSFGTNYTKCYLIGLMKQTQKKMNKEAAGPRWKLMKCDFSIPDPDRKTGVVKKLSKYLKKWNPRFMIVKGDYLIDYYENEDKYKNNQKPLGTINMSNLDLNPDANDTVLNRLIKLAEKMKLDIESLPKPDKYPDFTMEIYHSRKGPIYLQCEDEQEHKEWCKEFQKCRYYAPRYNEYEDRVHVWAFPEALRRTRWECNMWGWFWGGGGEIAQMVDAINDKIEDVVMYKVDEKLTMPYAARRKARDSFIKSVDGFVTSAVGPAWKGMYDGVCKTRPDVQDKMKDIMQPIVDAQTTVKAKILEMVESSSKDTINEKVTPHLSPLLDIVFSPITDSFKMIIKAFDKSLEEGKEKYTSHEKRRHMVRNHGVWCEMWDAERLLGDLYDPLYALRMIFDDIYPWGIVRKACRTLRKILYNALYTFENLLEDGKEAGKTWEEAASEARELLMQDCRAGVLKVLGVILYGVVENFWEKMVIRPAKELVKPLCDTIPDAVKDFVDPNDMLEDLLVAIIKSACAMVFEPYASRIEF